MHDGGWGGWGGLEDFTFWLCKLVRFGDRKVELLKKLSLIAHSILALVFLTLPSIAGAEHLRIYNFDSGGAFLKTDWQLYYALREQRRNRLWTMDRTCLGYISRWG